MASDRTWIANPMTTTLNPSAIVNEGAGGPVSDQNNAPPTMVPLTTLKPAAIDETDNGTPVEEEEPRKG